MMTKINRVFVALGTYFIATIGLFFTGSVWWYLLVPVGIAYIFFGGRKHV